MNYKQWRQSRIEELARDIQFLDEVLHKKRHEFRILEKECE